ncbi:hypothetical protein [Leifsonia shinshuensis]|uniref:hypothetical protein n=1 Tax=Leifsonia shinshuensis TaxID=150026 RepID=UPI00285B90B2|nr:hypothetical protein [Leifsonia shinshuensis]MDR6971317.1 hypothetical protein [Leifsonia shinshuensis]
MPKRTAPLIEPSPGRQASPHTRTDAWLRLRLAVADEYVSKLPELLAVDEFARLTGLTIAQVRHATTTGDLVVSLRDGRRGIAPEDNLPFLIRERLLRLPRPGRATSTRRARSLPISPAAYERIWDEAVCHRIAPEAALDRLLRVPSSAQQADADSTASRYC